MALWPASLTAEQLYHLNKAALKTGKADKEEVGLYRRSKILDRSVYSTLWLRSLRCQYRIQTNGHWLLAVPAWWQKKQLHSVSPLSASAHRENARYARLPIQPCLHLRRRFPKIYLWLFFFRTKFDSWPHAAASSLSQPSSLSVSQVLRQYEEARGRHLIFSQPVSSSNPAGPVPA